MCFFVQVCIVALSVLVFPLSSNRGAAQLPRHELRQAMAPVPAQAPPQAHPAPAIESARPRALPVPPLPSPPQTVALSVLVVGDSLSISLGEQLEEFFTRQHGVHFKRVGKVSSGLARPDFFDWEEQLTALANQTRPSLVVIMIGTNDNKPLSRHGGHAAAFGSAGWAREYTARAQRLLDICQASNPDARVFWVGAPIMGQSELRDDVVRINSVISDLCTRNRNCLYVDTWRTLADENGQFTQYWTSEHGERIKIRADDGVHLSFTGSRLLALRCLDVMLHTPPLQTLARPVAFDGLGG